MKANQRVVKSIPDKSGNAYTKTSAGGKQRMSAATRYMDERENTQLYTLENGRLEETDRYEAAAKVENSETKYQQHLVFTTELKAENTFVNERGAAEHVAHSIQERRPDADIYAIAVHSDGKGEEKHIHVHVAVGTDTTLRRDDLKHFREQAHELEKHIERDNMRELTQSERTVVRGLERDHQNHHQREAPAPQRQREMER